MAVRPVIVRGAASVTAIVLGAVAITPAPAFADTGAYTFSPVVISSISVGMWSPTEIDVWTRQQSEQSMTMTLRGSTGEVLRTAPADHQSDDTYLGAFRTPGLCAGSYTVRVANDADPSQYDEVALVLTSAQAPSCTATPQAPGMQESVSLVSSTPVSLDAGDGRFPLGFFARVYDAKGAEIAKPDATLVVASSSGRQWRAPHMSLLGDLDKQVVRGLPLGTYRYWIEHTAPDGTVVRSNSLELSTYRWTVSVTASAKKIVRRAGAPVRPVRFTITASLPAMPPAMKYGHSSADAAIATRIELGGTRPGHWADPTFVVARRHGKVSNTSSTTTLVFDGTVHGRYRPGKYGISLCAGAAGFDLDDGVCRSAAVQVIDKR